MASRLKDRFQRPAIAIAWDEAKGQGTGSARSLPGVDIGRAVRAAAEARTPVKGGGHAMAAGRDARADRLADFRAFLDNKLAADVAAARAAAASPSMPRSPPRRSRRSSPPHEPRGAVRAGQSRAALRLPRHVLTEVQPVGAAHLRLRFKAPVGSGAGAIAFRVQEQPLGEALLSRRGREVHAVGSLQVRSLGRPRARRPSASSTSRIPPVFWRSREKRVERVPARSIPRSSPSFARRPAPFVIG